MIFIDIFSSFHHNMSDNKSIKFLCVSRNIAIYFEIDSLLRLRIQNTFSYLWYCAPCCQRYFPTLSNILTDWLFSPATWPPSTGWLDFLNQNITALAISRLTDFLSPGHHYSYHHLAVRPSLPRTPLVGWRPTARTPLASYSQDTTVLLLADWLLYRGLHYPCLLLHVRSTYSFSRYPHPWSRYHPYHCHSHTKHNYDH